MPYGLPGEHNSDPSLNRWMERCVNSVEGKKDKDGNVLDKSSAIAICKKKLEGMNYNLGKASISLNLTLLNWEKLNEKRD